MSLFGAKPAFGGPTSTSGFSFGNTVASSAPAPLFGSTTTSVTKPLFGSTSTAGGSLFGSTTTAPAFSSQPTGGLFGAKPTTAANTFSFSSAATKPAGLFGSLGTQAAQAIPIPTLQDIIQNSDNLVRSLTSTDLYGDQRDVIIAKLNQLLAACGIGTGYFKADQQPVAYSIDGPFHRFKAIGYNRRSEYSDSDGIVALTLAVAYEQLATSAQRQKLIDALNIILGNNTNVRAHIESIRPLPGANTTEILMYVIEKGKGRVTCKDLVQYFKQSTQEAQLKNQLCATDVVARCSMDDAKLHAFLEKTPPGFDTQMWKQAVHENPDPKRLIPYPIRGFEQLRKRQELQNAEIRLEERVLDELKHRLVALKNELAAGQSRYIVHRQRHKELSYRLLRCLAMQILVQRYSLAIDNREEKLESHLEALNVSLVAPDQLKSRISNLIKIMREEGDTLKAFQKPSIVLKEEDASQIKKYLSRSQKGLESMVSCVNSNLNDLKIMASRPE